MSRSPGFSAFIISGRGFSVHPCTTHTAFGLAFFIASIIALPALPKSSLASKFWLHEKDRWSSSHLFHTAFRFLRKKIGNLGKLGIVGQRFPGRSNPFHLLRVLWADSEEVLLNVFSSFHHQYVFPNPVWGIIPE